eukprot:Opistho-2@74243
MTLGVSDLIAEAGRKRFSRTTVSQEEMLKIWDRVGGFIELQMAQNKGVAIPTLGSLSFARTKLEIGNKGQKVIQRPVFILSEGFASTFNMHHTKQRASGAIPVCDLNMSQIATELGFTRDDIQSTIKEVVHMFGLACARGVEASLGFRDFARVTCRNGRVEGSFSQAFIDSYNGGESTASYRSPSPQKSLAPARLPPLEGRTSPHRADADVPVPVPIHTHHVTLGGGDDASGRSVRFEGSEPAPRHADNRPPSRADHQGAGEPESHATTNAGHVHRSILVKGSSLLPRRQIHNPEYAKALEEQIIYQKGVSTKLKEEEEAYDRAVLAQLEGTVDAAELVYLEMHKKKRDEYARALADQITSREIIQSESAVAPAAFMDAVFTRPDAYVAHVQSERRAKARDFFTEQVTMMQSRKDEKAAKVAREREEMAQHLERVKEELRREFQANHHSAFEARRKIEDYWSVQVDVKKTTVKGDKVVDNMPTNYLQLRKPPTQRTPQQERQLWAFRRMVNAGLFFKA